MIRQTLRQAWTMMKQHRLFTGIYIAGTALSVTMIMITFAVLYIKFAPLYPEENRERTLHIRTITTIINDPVDGEHRSHHSCSPKLGEIIKQDSKYLDNLSCYTRSNNRKKLSATTEKNTKRIKDYAVYTDEGFWKVYTYTFVDGHPFGEHDVKSNNRVAVISRSTAMELFATHKVAGKQIFVDGEELTIVGVIKEAPSAVATTNAIYIPLGLNSDKPWFDYTRKELAGMYHIVATAKKASEKELLKKEIEEKIARYNAGSATCTYEIADNILTHAESVYDREYYGNDAYRNFIKEIVLIISAFLLIPAMCLSIMILSRMESRMVEMGVRKAYGATTGSIVLQVLIENMLLTLIGGIIGFAISATLLFAASRWVLFLFDSGAKLSSYLWEIDEWGEQIVDFSMIFNPTLFAATLIVCMLINIVSALLPVVAKMRHSIVYSLNRRK